MDGVTFAPVQTLHGWAQFSPFYPVRRYRVPPKGCSITQVNGISSCLKRHGARFPTLHSGERIKSAVDKLKSAKSYIREDLQFLKDYTYDLGFDDLVALGALQSYTAGQLAFTRYSHLLSGDATLPPFVRSTSSSRVIDSAHNWTSGFSFASQHRFNPVLSVIMSKDASYRYSQTSANNTLAHSGCPLAGDGDEKSNAWVNIYATPIAKRFNSLAIDMNSNLTAADVVDLISLCPFDSVAKQEPSQFCNIFEPEDFTNFEWGMNLDKYYGTGYGQPVGGRVEGVGYVNELIARLTNTPVRDNTQTNRTLDSDPATFPLDRSIFADFSHDNQMVAIYSALGLLNEKHEVLDETRVNPETEWDTSDVVSFSAEMVVERLSCAWDPPVGGYKPTEYVRIMINDALQPMSFCGADENGLCKLSKFVESQSYARNDGDGDFEKCFLTQT
ncbi:hypothetical protein AGABI2DRAFT_78719 [Agaricus bisporus var. bisporus H97]|uniref:hypothetical protein n=1 Tax=Agaricus bisporus var. bisporus (strain H97 / ATCC MYA-4626 / FGSC 10389) TaxID=936046 RepID=UPI00029F66EB|nr:hypothetical protein AGABI2DRAFT_78719 [Agaricus bisporus var. bisporus H97]EKV42619.1 hypothetical protein AGABI2DRAFT_78719 [Agaricus bisporus var. bisporus H97]